MSFKLGVVPQVNVAAVLANLSIVRSQTTNIETECDAHKAERIKAGLEKLREMKALFTSMQNAASLGVQYIQSTSEDGKQTNAQVGTLDDAVSGKWISSTFKFSKADGEDGESLVFQMKNGAKGELSLNIPQGLLKVLGCSANDNESDIAQKFDALGIFAGTGAVVGDQCSQSNSLFKIFDNLTKAIIAGINPELSNCSGVSIDPAAIDASNSNTLTNAAGAIDGYIDQVTSEYRKQVDSLQQKLSQNDRIDGIFKEGLNALR